MLTQLYGTGVTVVERGTAAASQQQQQQAVAPGRPAGPGSDQSTTVVVLTAARWCACNCLASRGLPGSYHLMLPTVNCPAKVKPRHVTRRHVGSLLARRVRSGQAGEGHLLMESIQCLTLMDAAQDL